MISACVWNKIYITCVHCCTAVLDANVHLCKTRVAEYLLWLCSYNEKNITVILVLVIHSLFRDQIGATTRHSIL